MSTIMSGVIEDGEPAEGKEWGRRRRSLGTEYGGGDGIWKERTRKGGMKTTGFLGSFLFG